MFINLTFYYFDMVKLEILNKDGSLDKLVEIDGSKNILDQMIDNGSSVIFGCFGGSCGSCKCKIESGEELIDKEAVRPAVLKGMKEKDFMPCIAKLKANINCSSTIRIKKYL